MADVEKNFVIEIGQIGEIGINHFSAKIYKFGLVDCRVGSGRRRSMRTSLCCNHQSAVASSLQRALSPAILILNKVFDSDITLLASFVTAVDNNQLRDNGTIFFVISCPFLLWLSNNTENILLYKVKWQH